MSYKLIQGNSLEVLKELPSGSIHTCVTSPPYYQLRNYGIDGQVGLENSPENYVDHLVTIFREMRRVLRDDGTFWLNIGDSYVASGGHTKSGPNAYIKDPEQQAARNIKSKPVPEGMKIKDLIGVPWLLAFALRADGWYLRSDIVWAKPNCTPESVRDRPTRAHEFIFLLTKGPKYYYDHNAIKEVSVSGEGKRNKRDVWEVPVACFKGGHFAVFPEKLISPCILAGTSEMGCCPQCGTPWNCKIAKEIPVSNDVEPIVRKGITLTPEDSAIVLFCESGKGQYRITVVGEKHHNNWTAQTTPNGRESHFRNKGYSLYYWGLPECEVWDPGCQCGITDRVPCTVLDPFNGAGTTGLVCLKHNRNYIGIDINPEYIQLSEERLKNATQATTG